MASRSPFERDEFLALSAWACREFLAFSKTRSLGGSLTLGRSTLAAFFSSDSSPKEIRACLESFPTSFSGARAKAMRYS